MRIYKNRYTFCLFLTLIVLSSAGVFFPINNSSFEPISEGYDALNLSDDELVINTPENKTYTKPMDGYYPGTYGFEDDINGATNEDINFIDTDSSSAGSYFEIISDFQNRNKVLKCVDGVGLSGFNGIHYFDNKTSTGTIEYWVLLDNVGILNGMKLTFVGDGGAAWYLSCYGGTFRSNGWVGMGSALANKWYHLKMEYDCSINEVSYFIDGELKRTINFAVGSSEMEHIIIDSDPSQNNNFNGYIDAVGFSWDLDYNIGDNLYEGLLLGFENSTRLDWIGYSLDGQSNRTILGNVTLPMPSFGSHTVQVFGNNTLGTMYQSNKVFFSISKFLINLLSPENITYTKPMSGYYAGTYGFEDEINGETNEDIKFIDTDSSSAGSHFEIMSEFQNHNKVLKCVDGSGTSAFKATHNFNNITSKGTVEFWYAIDNIDVYNGLNLRFFGNGIHAFYINCYKSYFRGNGWVAIGQASANRWYHIKLEYDCALHEVKYYIDGDYKRTFNIEVAVNQIEYMTLESDPTQNNLFNGYLDAIGFDWENGYDIDDNKHEGLLLSYETYKDLDWMGYSLDSKANITIMGDKAISMPRNGSHTIQVFGNDSLGDMFQSEKRYFTTHYNSVDIITPENITYTAPMDGYYPGTYGFENDQNGDLPEGWDCSHTGTGYTIKVIDEKYGHRKVLELSDNINSNYPLMVNDFPVAFRTIGTIELWIATTNAQQETYLSFRDSAGLIASIVCIDDGKIKFLYHGGGAWEYEINNDQWYHVRIDFNCDTDKMTYWLDQTKIGTKDFLNPINYLEKMHINTVDSDSAYSSYIDAIGYSWDSNYRIGDNYDEGILFSYENNNDLDWKEFSLDSQPRQSILGNKTLPVPVDGMHSIQFFAQDSLGDYYESDLRFFTVEIAPSVEWVTPRDGSTVILPYTKPPNENDGLFTFHYTYRRLDDIELEIDGTNLGSVWNATSIVLTPYANYTNGFLSATLIGKNNSVIVDSDTRSFQFVKIEHEITETLNSSTEVLGKQLYLILHDPHGDNSFSSISESTSLSIGVGCELAIAMGFSLEIGEDVDLFGVEIGGSALLSFKTTLSLGFDFRYEITDTTSLTSSQVTDDADYIGPGYGDRYWGESWIYKWVLNGTRRKYSNETEFRWEDPKLYYGILRGVETFASDEHAPVEWRNQNAVYNSSIPVQWESPFFGSGGAPYLHEREVSATTTRKISLQIDFGSDFRQKYGIVETHVTIDLSLKTYAEVVLGNTHKVTYEIYDDDPSDYIVQGRGIDQRFGTYLFNSSSFFCETSDPLEHNTYDYIPPVIDFPTINLDTNNDNFGPANDDSPLVRVNIFEEGGLQAVAINYTINNGLNWNLISLHELVASPGLWEGTIPSLTQGTKVKWYIIAWDSQGNRAERKDIYGNPFEYTVLEKPIVPSYPPMFIIVSLMTPIVAIILRNLKKLNKINT